ncbi:MAG: methyltransferase domain-containing protein, partial [Candidatus Omnitrophota bacterium]
EEIESAPISEELKKSLLEISLFSGRDFSFERLWLKIQQLLAYEGGNKQIVQAAIYNGIIKMAQAVFKGNSARGQVLGLSGEISGLYEAICKRGAVLENISLGTLLSVNTIVYDKHGASKEFDAMSENTVFEFKFHLTLRKLYQQVIGISQARKPHLKVLTEPKFSHIRNIVYFGETDDGSVVKAIQAFVQSRIKDSRSIPEITVIKNKGISAKFTLTQMKDFLLSDTTIKFAREEEVTHDAIFLPRNYRYMKKMIYRKLSELRGAKFDVIVGVSTADISALKASSPIGLTMLRRIQRQYNDPVRNNLRNYPGLSGRYYYKRSLLDHFLPERLFVYGLIKKAVKSIPDDVKRICVIGPGPTLGEVKYLLEITAQDIQIYVIEFWNKNIRNLRKELNKFTKEERSRVFLVQADARNIPFMSSIFDFVYSGQTFCAAIFENELKIAEKEALRVLSHSGIARFVRVEVVDADFSNPVYLYEVVALNSLALPTALHSSSPVKDLHKGVALPLSKGTVQIIIELIVEELRLVLLKQPEEKLVYRHEKDFFTRRAWGFVFNDGPKAVFINIGYLFFMDAAMYSRLSLVLREILGVNVILLHRLWINDIAKFPFSAFNTPVIINMMNSGIVKNKIALDIGCGDGVLSLVALKLGAIFAHMFEVHWPSLLVASEHLKLNGKSGNLDFKMHQGDIRQKFFIKQQIEIIRENIRNTSKGIVVISNIGVWDIYNITNADSINLIKHLPEVSHFIGGGYTHTASLNSKQTGHDQAFIRRLGFSIIPELVKLSYTEVISSWSARRKLLRVKSSSPVGAVVGLRLTVKKSAGFSPLSSDSLGRIEIKDRVVKNIINILEKTEYKDKFLFFGGLVRDLILGRQIANQDIDFIIPTEVDDSARRFISRSKAPTPNMRFKRQDELFGLAACLNLDFYQLSDGISNFAGRRFHPVFQNGVVFDSLTWKPVLIQTELSINLIAMDLQGNLYDAFAGIEDLKQGKARFVPGVLVSADNIKRAFRFKKLFSLKFTPETKHLVDAYLALRSNRTVVLAELNKASSPVEGGKIKIDDRIGEVPLAYLDQIRYENRGVEKILKIGGPNKRALFDLFEEEKVLVAWAIKRTKSWKSAIILGIGHRVTLPFHELVSAFDEVSIVDLDQEVLESAYNSLYHRPDFQRKLTLIKTDISGINVQMIRMLEAAPGRSISFNPLFRKRVKNGLRGLGQFDLVVSSLMVNQMLYPLQIYSEYSGLPLKIDNEEKFNQEYNEMIICGHIQNLLDLSKPDGVIHFSAQLTDRIKTQEAIDVMPSYFHKELINCFGKGVKVLEDAQWENEAKNGSNGLYKTVILKSVIPVSSPLKNKHLYLRYITVDLQDIWAKESSSSVGENQSDIVREKYLSRLTPAFKRMIGILNEYSVKRIINNYYLSGSIARGNFNIPPKDVDFAVSVEKNHWINLSDEFLNLPNSVKTISQETEFAFHVNYTLFGPEYRIRKENLELTGRYFGDKVLKLNEVSLSGRILIRLYTHYNEIINNPEFLIELYRKSRKLNLTGASSPVVDQRALVSEFKERAPVGLAQRLGLFQEVFGKRLSADVKFSGRTSPEIDLAHLQAFSKTVTEKLTPDLAQAFGGAQRVLRNKGKDDLARLKDFERLAKPLAAFEKLLFYFGTGAVTGGEQNAMLTAQVGNGIEWRRHFDNDWYDWHCFYYKDRCVFHVAVPKHKGADIKLAMGVGRQYEDWNAELGGLSSDGKKLLGKGFSLYCFAKQLQILFITRAGFSEVSILPNSVMLYFPQRAEPFYLNKVGGFSWPGLTRDLAQEEADYERKVGSGVFASSPISDEESAKLQAFVDGLNIQVVRIKNSVSQIKSASLVEKVDKNVDEIKNAIRLMASGIDLGDGQLSLLEQAKQDLPLLRNFPLDLGVTAQMIWLTVATLKETYDVESFVKAMPRLIKKIEDLSSLLTATIQDNKGSSSPV